MPKQTTGPVAAVKGHKGSKLRKIPDMLEGRGGKVHSQNKWTSWACWVKGWLTHYKTTFSPLFGRFFLVSKKDIFFFGRVIVWMFHIGRARGPGPGPRSFTPGRLSIEFVNVGGWLIYGDLALDSCAQFLAEAEHRLIPSRTRSICHQLRKAGHQSVLSPACQDQIAGGHAGVGGRLVLVVPTFSSLLCYSSV